VGGSREGLLVDARARPGQRGREVEGRGREGQGERQFLFFFFLVVREEEEQETAFPRLILEPRSCLLFFRFSFFLQC